MHLHVYQMFVMRKLNGVSAELCTTGTLMCATDLLPRPRCCPLHGFNLAHLQDRARSEIASEALDSLMTGVATAMIEIQGADAAPTGEAAAALVGGALEKVFGGVMQPLSAHLSFAAPLLWYDLSAANQCNGALV